MERTSSCREVLPATSAVLHGTKTIAPLRFLGGPKSSNLNFFGAFIVKWLRNSRKQNQKNTMTFNKTEAKTKNKDIQQRRRRGRERERGREGERERGRELLWHKALPMRHANVARHRHSDTPCNSSRWRRGATRRGGGPFARRAAAQRNRIGGLLCGQADMSC